MVLDPTDVSLDKTSFVLEINVMRMSKLSHNLHLFKVKMVHLCICKKYYLSLSAKDTAIKIFMSKLYM